MEETNHPSAASDRYARAHQAHYGSKNLRQALGLYEAIMVLYPDSLEAGYSRAQIQNIAKAVIPGQELFSVESRLAWSYLESPVRPANAGTGGTRPDSPPWAATNAAGR